MKEWLDSSWFNWVLLIGGFVGAVYLLNFIIMLITNLMRWPRYKKFMNYRKIRVGMTKRQVMDIFSGIKFKKKYASVWKIKAKWQIKLNADKIYELRIYFDSTGKVISTDLKTTIRSWRWVSN